MIRRVLEWRSGFRKITRKVAFRFGRVAGLVLMQKFL
jgi:hypothetical protein